MPADSLADDLLRTRSDYLSATRYERFLCDAYTGGGGFRGRIQRPDYSPEAMVYAQVQGEASYLDKFVSEADDEFTSRQGYSTYTNYCRPTTDLKVSYLLRKGWQYVNEPDVITEWRRRTRFDEANQRRATMAAVFGWVPVQVDMPATPADARTALEAGKPDPYVTQMYPIQLLDWDVDERGELIFAKTAVVTYVRADWRDLTPTKVTRVTVWTRDQFAAYAVSEGGADGAKGVALLSSGPHNFGRVPVVSWRAAQNLDDPMRGESIMGDVAACNRALYNIESEERSVMRATAFPTLVLPTKNPSHNIGEADADYLARMGVEMGAANALRTDPDQKNLPFYIAPPAEVFKTYSDLKQKSVIELYRLARVEYDRASGTASSAQSKQQNFEQTNLAVVDIAKALAHGILETLRLVGRALGVPDEQLAQMSVQAHDSYATEDLAVDEEITDVLLADTGMGETFHGEVRKRRARRVLSGISPGLLATIDGEIEEATKAAAELKAQQEATLVQGVGAQVNSDANADTQQQLAQGAQPNA